MNDLAQDTDPLADRLYRLRPALVVVLLLALIAAAAGGSRLEADFTPQKIFEYDDDAFVQLRQLQEVFGRDDNLFLVHLESDELFAPAVIDTLRTLHTELSRVPGVVAVDDLTTTWVSRPGAPLPTPLLRPGGDLREARDLALSHPLLVRQVVSADGKSGLIVARLSGDRMAFADLQPVVHGCQAVVDETPLPPGVALHTTGVPAARVLIAEGLINDQLRFFPLCTFLFVAILWLCFRDLRAVLVPMLAVGVATLYTAGLLGATGEPINIINNVLPVLIFVIAMSDAIHVIARYRRELAAGVEQRQALATTVRHLAAACLLTSLTTAAGLGSLAVAEISILRWFGLYAAAGVGLAYVVTVTFVPLAFSFLSPLLGDASRRVDEVFDAAAETLGRATLRHKGKIAAASAAFVALCIWLGSGVQVENNVYEPFPEDAPIRRANALLERDFAGIVPVSILVTWDEGTDVVTPEVLSYLLELQQALATEQVRALSLCDLIGEANVALSGGDPAARRIPESPQACRRALMALAMALESTGREEALRRFWAPEARMLRIVGRANDQGSRSLNAGFTRIEERLLADADRLKALGIRAALTGDGPVASRGIDRLISDLFSSLLLAFAVIFPLMCLLLRSLWAGLVSMIPNVFPLVTTLGFMGAIGMDLRVTTVIVFTVSLGLAVDDTIHFMARLAEEWRSGGAGPGAYEDAILRTFRGTGAAILLTTVLLVAGFSALMTSQFQISATFGLLLEVTVVAALVGDLVVLPAVLGLLAPRRGRG